MNEADVRIGCNGSKQRSIRSRSTQTPPERTEGCSQRSPPLATNPAALVPSTYSSPQLRAPNNSPCTPETLQISQLSTTSSKSSASERTGPPEGAVWGSEIRAWVLTKPGNHAGMVFRIGQANGSNDTPCAAGSSTSTAQAPEPPTLAIPCPRERPASTRPHPTPNRRSQPDREPKTLTDAFLTPTGPSNDMTAIRVWRNSHHSPADLII